MAACLFVLLALIFLGTLTAAYGFDGVAYCSFVEVALHGRGLEHLFQANHLLHGPLAYLFALATGGLASEVGVHVRLQVMDALLGAATIAGLFLLLQRLAGGATALAASMCVAFTYSFWHFSTDVEVYILAALLLLFALDRALKAVEGRTVAAAAMAGGAAGLAALGHIAHGFFALVTVVVLVHATPRGQKVRSGLAFGGGFSAVLVLGFAPLLVGPFSRVPSDHRLDFLLGYARPDALGIHLGTPWERIGPNLSAFLQAIFAQPSRGFWLPVVLIGATVLALAGLAWRRAGASSRYVLALALGWCLIHLVFFLMWDPNSKYWIAGMVPGAVVLSLAMEELGARTKRVHQLVILVVLPLGLLASNLPRILAEADPLRNLHLQVARAISEVTPNDAVIMLSGLAPHVELKVYVPYFGRRRTLVLDFYLRGAELDRGLTRLGRGGAAADRPFFALSELVDKQETQRALETRHGQEPGALTSALRRERFRPMAQIPGSLVLYRLDGAPEPKGITPP
jgi:hypothetical protein